VALLLEEEVGGMVGVDGGGHRLRPGGVILREDDLAGVLGVELFRGLLAGLGAAIDCGPDRNLPAPKLGLKHGQMQRCAKPHGIRGRWSKAVWRFICSPIM
jgi:hypothetical protein